MNKTFLIIAFIFIFIWAFSLNFFNLEYAKTIESKSPKDNLTVSGLTIYSPDNCFYLNFANNLNDGNGFVQYKNSPKTSVRRTPGYPLFIYFHLLIFGKENYLYFIKYTQLLFFVVSALLLGLAAYNFTSSSLIAKLTTILYGIGPVVNSYCFYTITESIYPAAICLFVYFFSSTNNKINLFLIGFSGAIMILIRPVTVLIFFLFISLNIIYNLKKRKLFKAILIENLIVVIGFLTLFAPWVVRNFVVTKGDIVLFEKYYDDAVTESGRDLLYLVKWSSSYSNPHNIEGGYLNVIQNYNENDEISARDSFTINWVSNLPDYAFSGTNKQEITSVLIEFNNCQKNKQDLYRKNNETLSYIDIESMVFCDEVLKKKFILLIDSFKASNPIQYYFKTPISLLTDLIFHSFSGSLFPLNHYSLQFKPLVLISKTIMYILNIFLISSALILILLKEYRRYALMVVLIQITTFLFLAYSHRRAEVRYIMQLYPLLYVTSSILLYELIQKIKLFRLPLKYQPRKIK